MLEKYSKKPLITINIYIENSQESTIIKRKTTELRIWIWNEHRAFAETGNNLTNFIFKILAQMLQKNHSIPWNTLIRSVLDLCQK